MPYFTSPRSKPRSSATSTAVLIPTTPRHASTHLEALSTRMDSGIPRSSVANSNILHTSFGGEHFRLPRKPPGKRRIGWIEICRTEETHVGTEAIRAGFLVFTMTYDSAPQRQDAGLTSRYDSSQAMFKGRVLARLDICLPQLHHPHSPSKPHRFFLAAIAHRPLSDLPSPKCPRSY
jgi:hypothetical protein